jgi:hypothetical protein
MITPDLAFQQPAKEPFKSIEIAEGCRDRRITRLNKIDVFRRAPFGKTDEYSY